MVSPLSDPRDTPRASFVAQCTIIVAAAVFLFYLGTFSWWLAALYWVIWGSAFGDRGTTMLHTSIHRPVFAGSWSFLNGYVTWIIAPLFGQIPTSFYVHHVAMHHPEGNLLGDLSSTMPFQRDSFLGFLRYWLRFALLGIPELAIYQWRKGRTKLMLRLLLGQVVFLGAIIGLGSWHLQPTLVVLVIPYIFTNFMLMAGNWGQHAFIDPDEPDNDFKNSLTVITPRYNNRCFNDGYHTFHHIKPTAHYTDLPAEFEQNREKYGRADCLVFDKLDFVAVWFLLMAGRYHTLARYVVRLPGAPERTDDELVALFQRRLAPIRTFVKAGAA